MQHDAYHVICAASDILNGVFCLYLVKDKLKNIAAAMVGFLRVFPAERAPEVDVFLTKYFMLV